MQLDCPHCGAPLSLPATSREIQQGSGVGQRLQGDDQVCETCEREVGVYYYRT